jgi:hypothetical protein
MTTDPNHTVFEIALYRVHDGEVFAARHHELHTHVATLEGFVRAEALRSHEQPDVFADVVEWAGLGAATAAAGQVADSPIMEWFGPQLAEMLFFGHLERNPLVAQASEVMTA